jgi:transposase
MKPYTLRPGVHLTHVYVYRDFVDFRKGHKGLSALIEHELGQDVFSGTLYVFGNRQRTRIKCLFWEDNGFVLYYKALAEDKFHWPQADDELITLTGEQLNWLLDGFNLGLMKPHRALHYESVA